MAEPVPSLDERALSALPIFPLPDVVLFPSATLPLHVFEPRYRALTRDVLSGNRLLAMARLKPGFEGDYDGRPPVYEMCGVGQVVKDLQHPDGRYNIVLRGVGRVRIVEELPPEQLYRVVRAERVDDELSADPALIPVWKTKLGELWGRLGPHLPESLRDLHELTSEAETAGAYADTLAAAVLADPSEAQRMLEELDPAERLRLLVERVQELSDALFAGPPSQSKLN
ncbi:MAG TPA: LON peptidase substrate-binding domain-containing protein [Polyangiaceae bacterium]|nr:LON peptidase substrate-binding domain-containing protein [Polyangiaceae bacterium]